LDASSSDNDLIAEPPDAAALMVASQARSMMRLLEMVFQIAIPPLFSMANPKAKLVHMMPLHLVRLKLFEPAEGRSKDKASRGSMVDMSHTQTPTLNHFLSSMLQFLSSIGLVSSGGAVENEKFIRGVLHHTGYAKPFMLPFDPTADNVMGVEKKIERPDGEEDADVEETKESGVAIVKDVEENESESDWDSDEEADQELNYKWVGTKDLKIDDLFAVRTKGKGVGEESDEEDSEDDKEKKKEADNLKNSSTKQLVINETFPQKKRRIKSGVRVPLFMLRDLLKSVDSGRRELRSAMVQIERAAKDRDMLEGEYLARARRNRELAEAEQWRRGGPTEAESFRKLTIPQLLSRYTPAKTGADQEFVVKYGLVFFVSIMVLCYVG
jgi:hypothetical protein